MLGSRELCWGDLQASSTGMGPAGCGAAAAWLLSTIPLHHCWHWSCYVLCCRPQPAHGFLGRQGEKTLTTLLRRGGGSPAQAVWRPTPCQHLHSWGKKRKISLGPWVPRTSSPGRFVYPLPCCSCPPSPAQAVCHCPFCVQGSQCLGHPCSLELWVSSSPLSPAILPPVLWGSWCPILPAQPPRPPCATGLPMPSAPPFPPGHGPGPLS